MDIIKPAIVGMMCWGAMGCTEFVVTKTSDSNDGSCSASDCSLREAIIAANSSPGLDLITVPAGTYRLTREGPYENDAETGDLDIKESVTVNGFGSELTIIDGVEADRIFDVHTGNVAIRALTVTNGKIDTGGAGIKARNNSNLILRRVIVTRNFENGRSDRKRGNFWEGGHGGGIFSLGDLDIQDSEISFNLNTSASGLGSTGGAGIYHNGSTEGSIPTEEFSTIKMRRVLVFGNRGWGDGGGLLMFRFSKGEIIDSQFDSNKTTQTPDSPFSLRSGGGISNFGRTNELLIRKSRIVNNLSSGSGGGIKNFGKLEIRTTTIDDNSAESPGAWGGGLWNSNSETKIIESTISNNRAGDLGGGILGGARFDMINSTVSGNTARIGGGMVLFNDFPYVINYSTIVQNRAGEGAAGIVVRSSAALVIHNTIIAENLLPLGVLNCEADGPIATLNHNLADDGTCGLVGPNDIHADPLITDLADHGGPTLTHALLPGSPAVNAAAARCPSNDQTLFTRPFGSSCDIGSYEERRNLVQPIKEGVKK